MIDLKEIWNMGRVRRWHTNADLSHTNDFVDGHSARVARMCMALWPDEVHLALAALQHDDEEYFTCDMATPAKRALSDAYAEIERYGSEKAVDVWERRFYITNFENSRRLKFVDCLDAYKWAKTHRRDIIWRDGWDTAARWLQDEAEELGVKENIQPLMFD